MQTSAPSSRREARLHSRPSRLARAARVVVALAVVAALVVGGAVIVFGPQEVLDRVALRQERACPAARITLSATPGVAPVLREALSAAGARRLPDGSCLAAEVVEQPAADALAGFQVLPRDRWPQLWVPDSSAWASQGTSLDLRSSATLATSPVVLATSARVVTARGWDAAPPSWGQALTSGLPLAAPDLAGSSEALSALVALRATSGDDGERAVAAAALAAQRAGVATVAEALDLAAGDSSTAPLVPLSEQAVTAATAGVREPSLTAVYPAPGSPVLDYPLLRVGTARWDERTRQAADAVRAVLTGEPARTRLADAGFRDARGARPPGSDVPETVQPLRIDAVAQLTAVVTQLRRLATPTRMIVAMDVSASMRAQAGPGLTRIALVRAAAAGALALLPDTDAVGVWTFAGRRDGRPPWDEVSAVAELGDKASATGHRATVSGTLDRLPDALRADGTGLYATAVAAVRRAREVYDPNASNVVVLLTDGANDDPRGPSLAEAVAALQVDSASPPVRLIAVGISADADLRALTRLAEATPNGRAYRAAGPDELRTVLFDALSSRG